MPTQEATYRGAFRGEKLPRSLAPHHPANQTVDQQTKGPPGSLPRGPPKRAGAAPPPPHRLFIALSPLACATGRVGALPLNARRTSCCVAAIGSNWPGATLPPAPPLLPWRWWGLRSRPLRKSCASGGVWERHCSTLFMKQVLPRLMRPTPWERGAAGDAGVALGLHGGSGVWGWGAQARATPWLRLLPRHMATFRFALGYLQSVCSCLPHATRGLGPAACRDMIRGV